MRNERTIDPRYVGIYDNGYNQVFSEAIIEKAVVKEPSRLMDHPLESGSEITDHRIIEQIRIELSICLPEETAVNTYRTMRQAYLKGTLFSVKTKSLIYSNQVIEDFPHEENTENFNMFLLALKFRQVQFATSVTTEIPYAPKDPLNADTVDKGTIQPSPTPVPAKQQSASREFFRGR